MSASCSAAQEQQKVGISFTSRELQCLQQVMQAKSLIEISKHLNVTQKTLYFYLTNIRKKLDSYVQTSLS